MRGGGNGGEKNLEELVHRKGLSARHQKHPIRIDPLLGVHPHTRVIHLNPVLRQCGHVRLGPDLLVHPDRDGLVERIKTRVCDRDSDARESVRCTVYLQDRHIVRDVRELVQKRT